MCAAYHQQLLNAVNNSAWMLNATQRIPPPVIGQRRSPVFDATGSSRCGRSAMILSDVVTVELPFSCQDV